MCDRVAPAAEEVTERPFAQSAQLLSPLRSSGPCIGALCTASVARSAIMRSCGVTAQRHAQSAAH
eukprot:9302355-Lingulodinium_polyedra.AAC.1